MIANIRMYGSSVKSEDVFLARFLRDLQSIPLIMRKERGIKISVYRESRPPKTQAVMRKNGVFTSYALLTFGASVISPKNRLIEI